MKKILILLFSLMFLFSINTAMADPDARGPVKSIEKKEENFKVPHCPKTLISDNKRCMDCHTIPTFKLKEQDPSVLFNYPNINTRIINNKGYIKIDDIAAKYVYDSFNYFYKHNLKYIIVDIHSPGGSVMEAWRINGIIQEAKNQGVIIETRCYGFAASAGFLVFVSGTKGHRYVNPHAELMWHEVISFKLFDITSPSDKEDEARVLRHFQNNSNSYLASVSNMKKEDIDKMIHKKEFWMTGADAIKHGFADGEIK